jgi:hypothetical protein
MSGGSSNRAADEANRAEAARQAAIKGTQARVNQVFDGSNRQADIADYVNATRTYFGQDLDRQKDETDRQLKFAMARNGLMGGSVNRDTQKQFGEEYGRGLLEVERKAQGAGAELEAADQDARARLIQLATSGLDATTAASQAAAALRTNLAAGKAGATANGLGDMFGTFSQFIRDSREEASKRNAADTAYARMALYNTGYGGGP